MQTHLGTDCFKTKLKNTNIETTLQIMIPFTLRSVSSLNNPQNSETNFCEDMKLTG